MPAKKNGISKYKLARLAAESLKNSLRLHFDSILLFKNSSYSTAFQLSVLSLEEFAKATRIEDYVWTSETNDGYPDAAFEQRWLQSLYRHTDKQWAFIRRFIFEYSPKFAKLVQARGLEEKKQRAVYVGLARVGGRVDIRSRVSTPSRIKRSETLQLISLVNREFLSVCERLDDDDFCFDIPAMDVIFDRVIHLKLLKWPHRTRLRSRHWEKTWLGPRGSTSARGRGKT